MALVKYNNNSISAITAASSLPTGAMTLIKEQTASSSSTIDFVDGTSDVVLDSTYPIYLIKVINAHPGTDDVAFQFQANAAGGSGFNETMTTTTFKSYHNEGDSLNVLSYVTAGDQAQGTSYQGISSVENDNQESCSGELWLFNPSSTTYVKHFMARFQDIHSAVSMDTFTAGYFNTTSAIDEISFKCASGNIDSGTFKLYGIKDS
jgi:hypothetical protein